MEVINNRDIITSSTNSSAKCDPINPAPPVIKHFLLILLTFFTIPRVSTTRFIPLKASNQY